MYVYAIKRDQSYLLGRLKFYTIKSKIKNYIYVGISQDIEERLNRHNSGHEKTTKPYLPFELIYCVEKPTREEVRAEEKRLKTTQVGDF